MKTKLFPVALAGLSLVALASCSRGDDDDAAAAAVPAATVTVAPATTAVTTTAPAAAERADAATNGVAVAKVGDSDLGKVMTNASGLTLYGFVNDVNAISTCYSTCADAWPPVIVDADWAVGPGLDTGVFSTTERDDGTLQLVAGKYPLYTYGGDAAPGDVTGQGSGDVWFAMDLDGTLISEAAAPADATATTAPPSSDPYGEAAAPASTAPAAADAPAPITIAATDLGDVMVDADGRTVYAFTKDEDGTPTCEGGCAEAWPPVLVDGTDLPAGLDADVFSVVERPDGQIQLKAGKWPLYTFAGDEAPGDVNGQGSGGVWFVLDQAAKLVK